MRMVIILNEQEQEVLRAISESDLRFPREQLRYLLRLEAKRRGLLPTSDTAGVSELQDGLYTD